MMKFVYLILEWIFKEFLLGNELHFFLKIFSSISHSIRIIIKNQYQ